MCVCEQLARLCMHAFLVDTWNVSLCALLHLQAQTEWQEGEQPALQPSACSPRFDLLCTAPLCQATDNTQPRLWDRGGGRNGGRERERETGSSTHSGADKLSAFCLTIVSAVTDSLLSHSSATKSQRSTCALSPSLSLDPIFVWLLPPPHSFSSSFFFFFLCPRRSEMVWLVNPGRPRLIALCITPQEKETDLQTDKEREKPGRKKRMRKWETARREWDRGVGGVREEARAGERENSGEREDESGLRWN